MGIAVNLVMDEKGSHQEKERPMDQHVKDEIKDTMIALEAHVLRGARFGINISVLC